MNLLLAGLAVITTVPFVLVNNQIVVQASVNGKGPYSFLVDTGVTPSVIDRTAAEAAGVAVDTSRAGQPSGAGSGRMAVHRAAIGELTLSGVSFREATLTIAGQPFSIAQAGTGPTMSLDKPSLNFGAASTGVALAQVTGTQTVRLSQSGTGSVSWTATPTVPSSSMTRERSATEMK